MTSQALPPALTDADFLAAAASIGCEVAAIHAVALIEAGGYGFLMSGRPKILFEAHLFSRLTAHVYDRTNPDISSPVWNRALYVGGEGECDRLAKAATLNRDAALKSCSWGKFQILGSNYAACGFDSVQSFVTAMYQGEGPQLQAFVAFVKSQRLDRFLVTRDWTSFARGYNGPGYAQNQYDIKLGEAYDKFSGH